MSRDEILRRFEQWLDGALSAADLPSGIDAEILSSLAAENGDEPTALDRRSDGYALWATVTALTQEVKLQGRAFKELSDGIGLQVSRISEEIRAVYRERERELQREAERRCRRELLGALIDLRDRLGRGLESVRATQSEAVTPGLRSWLERLFARRDQRASADRIAALTKGYELGLERLDQTLDELNAHQIRCEGEMFDPRRMNAIDREEAREVPEGTVLEVYQHGYEWNGELFRPAQVKVSCAPAPEDVHE
jgi:molecular chaperone GrpE